MQAILWVASNFIPFLVPADATFLFLPICIVLGIVFFWFRSPWYVLAVVGVCNAAFHVNQYLQLRYDQAGIKEISIEARVESLPDCHPALCRFRILVSEGELKGRRYLVTWYRPPQDIQAGDRWRLMLRLRRLQGLANKSAFDLERWAMAQGIHGRASVVEGHKTSHYVSLNRLRGNLLKSLQYGLPESQGRELLLALMTGDRSRFESRSWDALKYSGTSHLVAISGMHISLVFAFGLLLARLVTRPLWLRISNIPAQKWELSLAWISAFMYSMLAGMPLSTQRALMMLTLWCLARWLNRPAGVRSWLSLAVLLMVLHDPFVLIDTGFWLSVLAVMILGLMLERKKQHFLLALWASQWRISVMMMPVNAVLAAKLVWLSLPVNLLALPLVSFLVLPIGLLALLLFSFQPQFAIEIMTALALFLERCIGILSYLVEYMPQIDMPGYMSSILPALLFLLPLAFLPGNSLRLPLVALVIGGFMIEKEHHGFGVEVLDIGQGLAVIIRVNSKTLLYDTGPKSFSAHDLAGQVISPLARANGIERFDALIVSHGDSDHAGGVATILREFNVSRVYSSYPHLVNHVIPCEKGQQWQWGDVEFEILYPAKGSPYLGNNSSCVLRVRSPNGSVLLPGDISTVVETRLQKENGLALRSDLLISPHHGSATSSSMAFIDAVHPAEVIHAAAFNNRFGFPVEEVSERYRHAGIRQWITGRDGAVQCSWPAGKLECRSERQGYAPVWRFPVAGGNH